MTDTRETLTRKQRDLKAELVEVQRKLRALPIEKKWPKLTERQRRVLIDLPDNDWVAPLEIGGSDGSHHSSTLESLVKRGFAERQRRSTLTTFLGGRGSWEYRRTPAGASKASL